MKRFACMIALSLPLALAGCVHVKVDPIYARIDVNVRVDRELDSFFQQVEQRAQTAPAPAPAPVPAPPPVPNVPATQPTESQPKEQP